jgi:hypothetical protein
MDLPYCGASSMLAGSDLKLGVGIMLRIEG